MSDAIGRILKDDPSLEVKVVSPTATVDSNRHVGGLLKSGNDALKARFTYESLAASLWVQLQELCVYAQDNIVKNDRNENINQGEMYKMIIFVEESTFGRGVSDLVNKWRSADKKSEISGFNNLSDSEMDSCIERFRVVQFPQNISAIRAEHFQEDQQVSDSWLAMLQLRRRLLELDFSGLTKTWTVRPPISGRSVRVRTN